MQTGLGEICGAIGASYTNLTNPVLAIISSFKAEFELRPDLENETKQVKSVREMKGRLTGIRHDLNWLGEVMGGTYLTLQNQPIPKKASDVKAIKCKKNASVSLVDSRHLQIMFVTLNGVLNVAKRCATEDR